ncbi:MAG: DUF3795 domain-containing protein [Clostridia bacterium]|nr:DUF3795 domain-containing protein [Clostridia bacterium]
MVYRQRKYPLFSACGLNCGLCPRYHMNGASRCPGCAGENFSEKHPSCGVLSCSQRHGVECCCICAEFPCERYGGADLADSFITHKNQLRDLGKAKGIGLAAYKTELNNKVGLLENLLANYDDGRRKSFFCIAVNLLEINDIEFAMEQTMNSTDQNDPVKEKAAVAVRIFQETAEKRNVVLKLRKK